MSGNGQTSGHRPASAGWWPQDSISGARAARCGTWPAPVRDLGKGHAIGMVSLSGADGRRCRPKRLTRSLPAGTGHRGARWGELLLPVSDELRVCPACLLSDVVRTLPIVLGN